MRYATVRYGERTAGARVEGDRLVLLEAGSAIEAWAGGGGLAEVGEVNIAMADLAPVSPAPAHIVCVGLNYRSHIEQLGRPVPEHPTLFAKYSSTLTGPRDAIVLPSISDRVQGEVELAVVVGRRLHRADSAQAITAIAGYAVANDLSLRDWQHRTSEALQGKVFDRSTPLGPMLVTGDEVDDARDLGLCQQVDGVSWQSGVTADMVFSPAQLVAYCSTFMTLEQGDVILTGTPGMTPQASCLHDGSVLVTSIEGLGRCVNRARAEPNAAAAASLD